MRIFVFYFDFFILKILLMRKFFVTSIVNRA